MLCKLIKKQNKFLNTFSDGNFFLKTLAFVNNRLPVYTRGCISAGCPEKGGAVNNNELSGIFCCSSDYCNNLASDTLNILTTTVNYNLMNQSLNSRNFINSFLVLILSLLSVIF